MKAKIFILLAILVKVNLFGQNNEWVVFNQNNSLLPVNSVKAIEFDGNDVWIGTISGLAIKASNSWQVFNTSNSSLENDYIRSIAIDNSGTKWIGTTNGLVSVNGNPSERGWNVFNSSNSGLPFDNVSAVVVDATNKKWFGTWGGGICVFDNGTWSTFDMYNSPLPANGIYDVKADAFNNIWIATHGGGLAKFDGSNWVIFNANNSSLPSNLVYSIDFDLQSNIWLGTEAGLVKFDGISNWTLYNANNTGWNFTSVMSVKVDKISQKVYFGTYYGLGIFYNGNFSFKTIGNSALSHNWVSSINIDSYGNKWLGTLGGGISVYNESGVILTSDDVSNINKIKISAYPNPATSQINLSVDFINSKDIVVKIFDIAGNLMKEISNTKLNNNINYFLINISDMPSGLYFCTVKNNIESVTTKFIKI